MNVMQDIEYKYKDFRKTDFNHRTPNALFISIDAFNELLKNYHIYGTSRLQQDIVNRNKWECLGMDVFIIENKRNFVHIAFV